MNLIEAGRGGAGRGGAGRGGGLQITFFGFPYGNYQGITAPFSFDRNITTNILARKTGSSDVLVAPIMALLPPSLLTKAVSDLGVASALDASTGLRFADAASYCSLSVNCDPDYSVAATWNWSAPRPFPGPALLRISLRRPARAPDSGRTSTD